MSREELKEIICRVIAEIRRQKAELEPEAPQPGCIFSDEPCDVTTYYGVNEEG